MQRMLDIEAIFPITDAASAALMAIKADRLHKAGVITELEERQVYSKARTFLDGGTPTPPDHGSAAPSLPCAVI